MIATTRRPSDMVKEIPEIQPHPRQMLEVIFLAIEVIIHYLPLRAAISA